MNHEFTLAQWTIVLAIATICLAIATVVMTIFSYRESRRNAKVTKFKVYLDIMHLLDATHDEREEIIKLIIEDKRNRYNDINKAENPDGVNQKAELIIRDIDKMALMWENKTIPDELIYYYSRAIVSTFIYFSNKIKHSRENKKNSRYRRKYQNLFIFADKYRHREKGYELNADLYDI